MDIPIYLEQEEFVDGQAEIRQMFELILKNEYSEFLSNWKLGSMVSPHIQSIISLDIMTRSAIKAIPVKIVDLQYSIDTIKITYSSQYGKDTYIYENL